ncbi:MULTISPECIES: CheR family methyltransferase [Sphingobacterium]|jgi:chemotaxis protein methyltransferase CheR|uniref:Putative methyltransferase Cher3 n=3 Tax=Sphingobacterium multivorum TaxID=28454 RepID=A0A654DFT7_SPHMU|nr:MULTISPECIES: protein-glutamate O-methyltransferase CheR [Sphingobacterium]HAE67998.1 chemotaxis protein CheR [Sphingobacterium sp.]QQT45557.1 protein-glutamate O-methyltransferase CheR [Sphingobacterium multivorum]QQT61797.1 protein-glutamate O-methyltransferase CheR [Sphingobacterium multivorum]SUJ26770.1 Chemotaxis protein methyltransferase [Sphingobacterium multivorum]VXD04829.1 putative methyltransferase Cher3 [Sphingobacterium multivorum]
MLGYSIIKDHEIDILLEDIYRDYGYDFLQYSRASMKRRINRLMTNDRLASFAELRFVLKDNPAFLQHFVEEITVNLTEMFRDPLFFRQLREEILPQLGTYPLIRVWIAGCSTGEEAYSMSILLKEANLYHKSLIYATDINPRVLDIARNGVYPLSQIKSFSENYIESGGKQDFSKYYTANYEWAKFDADLKQKMILSTHNLVSDTSFNSFQLILCRNVLIYFNKDLQERVFKLFDASLENLGYLALGSKETIRFSGIQHNFTAVGDQKIWKKLFTL